MFPSNIGYVLKECSNLEIELLLAHVLKKPKEFLYLYPNRRLTQTEERGLMRNVKRRLKGEPMAYILGYKDFCGLRFKVNKNVLVPRPETEEMVERVTSDGLSTFAKASADTRVTGKTIKILDVGTGSGCIAVSLAKQFSINNFQFSITASDISLRALKVAKENAKAHKVYVKFVQSDLLKKVTGRFDIIIANLPYGWKQWKNNTSVETAGLKFEPKKALFTGEKGLLENRRLLKQIAGLRHQPELVYLEFDPRQKKLLSKLIKKISPGWQGKFYKDLNGLWRFVEIKTF